MSDKVAQLLILRKWRVVGTLAGSSKSLRCVKSWEVPFISVLENL